MNKYFIKIPYSYLRNGNLTCFVYASNEDSAAELAEECGYRYSEDEESLDEDGPTEYDYSDMSITLEEEDVEPPHTHHVNGFELNLPASLPEYFLAEINKL
jgi:nucleosome binding factor SPN SPT16 subunit